MLYDLLMSMENVTSVGAIVGKKLAESFVEVIFDNRLELLDTSYAEAFHIIENEEFMYVSVLNCPTGRVEYTIQELFYDNGVQALIEDDIIFIEDNLLDVYDEKSTYGKIAVIHNEEPEEEDVIAELTVEPIKPVTTFYDVVDGIVEHILDVVSKERCPKCLRAELEEILINAYEYGVE